MKKPLAILEIILIFIGIPLLYKFDLIPFHKSIPLVSIFLIYFIIILFDKSFNKKILGFNHFKNWKSIIIRFLIISSFCLLAVYLFNRDSLFIIIRSHFLLWVLIIFFYPIWSAYTQELIYRTYFFHRFRFLIKNEKVFIVLNAVLFSFSHIIYNNWIALISTFIISILFSYTYLKSHSQMAVFIEHSLYGNMIFTIGLGNYFYLPLSPS